VLSSRVFTGPTSVPRNGGVRVFVADRAGRWFPAFLPVLAVSVLGAAGCWSSHADWSDGETPEAVVPEDGGAAEDATGTEDAGVDEGGVPDDVGVDDGGLDDGGADDAGVDDGDVPDDASSPCPEGWYDPTSGLCWQEPTADTDMDWYEAVSYCENLVLGGYPAGTWRLPTISELRSLIRGCPTTETGGGCGVTDSCLGWECSSDACWGCTSPEGPGAGGRYWPPELAGAGWYFWSSSSYSVAPNYAWLVDFHGGVVYVNDNDSIRNVRCIRRGP
jgi:hypothetical protein